jgi:hypothetical protein
MKPAMPVDINETTQRTLDSIESLLVLEVASVKRRANRCLQAREARRDD